MQQKLTNFVFDLNRTPFINHNTKFLLLTSNYNINFYLMLRNVFDIISITNFATLLDNSENIFVLNTFPPRPDKFSSYPLNEIFDKSHKINKNQTHTIVVHSEPPNVVIHRGIRSIYVKFLQIIQQIEGSNMNIRIIKSLAKSSEYITRIPENRDVMLGINTEKTSLEITPKLFTYKMLSFCILIPIKNEKSLGGNILLKVSKKIVEIIWK